MRLSLAAFPQPRHACLAIVSARMDGRDAPNPLLPQSECTRSVPYFLLPPSYIFAVTLIQLLGQDGCHHHAGGSCATLLSSKRRKRATFLILSFGHYNVTQTNSLNANPPYPVITNYPAPNSFKFEVAKQWNGRRCSPPPSVRSVFLRLHPIPSGLNQTGPPRRIQSPYTP